MKHLKKYFKGGLITAVGYVLSPLSFWNDMLVNIPLAYGFAYLFSFLIKGVFLESMIIFYWITNIVGMLMMHYGVKKIVSKNNSKLTKKDLIINIIISIAYTLLIVLLIKLNILKLPFNY
ncbi:MAG: hypothetical protein WCY27_02520 [archaeon]|jgi:hypothetical protein|nr:hypothetical protein [archaeon]MDD2478028.1 hypothetical protein [Candidatus ainarchaeum sp.]MDD3084797.1 hypothetical protein [Candidatus ainarchaeum sp.]MDD4221357.1 hypothetical protein [Candidatus ainarchaeum sp.]MDD4662652.1 hypothetical protein [Candidatus ainarchaeum sp.]